MLAHRIRFCHPPPDHQGVARRGTLLQRAPNPVSPLLLSVWASRLAPRFCGCYVPNSKIPASLFVETGPERKLPLRVRSIRLRTKFLAALLTISAGLTLGVLLVVRYTVENRVRESLRQDLRVSVRSYRVFDDRRAEEMARGAALIADLPTVRALMTTEDDATIQDASGDILKLSGADVLVLASRVGKITGLHSTTAPLPRAEVQTLLEASLKKTQLRDWWWTNGHLFEVLVEPIEMGRAPQSTLLGVLAIGHEVTAAAVGEFKDIAGAETAFLLNRAVVATTLSDDRRSALALDGSSKSAFF